jgi:hypothetical protein
VAAIGSFWNIAGTRYQTHCSRYGGRRAGRRDFSGKLGFGQNALASKFGKLA